jgi:1-deoxy-D-xylulose-5-phosphate reductoisomerase
MKIAILGSTGSIGHSTLEVIEKYPEKYQVVGLSAGFNAELLQEQIRKFKPKAVSLSDESGQDILNDCPGTEVLFGVEGACKIAAMPEADVVVAAISGSAGLLPTLEAVKAGKTVALANKESLVMAGELIISEAKKNKADIIPVDSEHSAIFQLLKDKKNEDVKNIILTASGGPFLGSTLEELENVSPEEALKHPRWKMGNKVTIDSASMMNKGLEVIEAHYIFGMPAEKIKVIVHPQSIVHSMVEFIDGTVFAQLSHPDMKAPIAYALSCPDRLDNIVEPLSFADIGKLTFEDPDYERFPNLRLAFRALETGGLMPVIMNSANEVAVQKFCDGLIGFTSISKLIEKVMDSFNDNGGRSLDDILEADKWARDEAVNSILKNGWII